MSSMRNAVTRRPHRERAQPASRSKWGLLEKHKDYSLRAQDYNTKKKKLAALTSKVRDRHPDEFAYGMVGAKQGKHGRGGDENRLSHDAVKLLKSQDAGYLRTVLSRGRKEMRRTQEEIGAAGHNEGEKIVFEDEPPQESSAPEEAVAGEVLDAVGTNDVVYPDLSGIGGVSGTEDVEISHSTAKGKPRYQDATARLRTERKKRKRLQETRLIKLEMLKKRQKEIMAAAEQLDLQRAKMAKSVGGTNKNGVKFKVRERKR